MDKKDTSLAALDGEDHLGTNEAHSKQKVNIQQNGSSFCGKRIALKCFSLMAVSSHEDSTCLIPLISTENQIVCRFTASLQTLPIAQNTPPSTTYV